MKRCTWTDPRAVGGACPVARRPVLTLTLPPRRTCEHLHPGDWSADRMRRLPLAAGAPVGRVELCRA